MASIGSLTLSSDMNLFCNRLATIRKNHGLAAISQTFVANVPTQSSQMVTLKSNLENTANSSQYIPDKTFDLHEIGVGSPTKYQSFSAINEALNYMESVCVHNSSDYSRHSDYGDDSDRAHDAGDVNKGDVDRNYGDVD